MSEKTPYTSPVLLQGLLVREQVFLDLYVASEVFTTEFSGTNIPTYFRAVLAFNLETQTARFLKSR